MDKGHYNVNIETDLAYFFNIFLRNKKFLPHRVNIKKLGKTGQKIICFHFKTTAPSPLEGERKTP